MMQLNKELDLKLDFLKADDKSVRDFINSVIFEAAPESNLVVKKSIVKRESGAFNTLKDSTAVLTRDK